MATKGLANLIGHSTMHVGTSTTVARPVYQRQQFHQLVLLCGRQ